jgi:GGDEF domain-containing protein
VAAAWNDLPATGGLHECAALVGSAEVLRVSAPELSVQIARRAMLVGATDASAGTTNVGEARDLSMRAQALLTSGLVRVSQHAKAVEPGFAALALAESGGAPDVAALVRIDLAACAQQVGEPLLGGAILRPVLESAQTPPSVRATALGRLVGCVAHAARRDDIEDALAEADRLLAADNGITADVRRMERARLAVRSAGYHRWYGDTEDAVTAAREGLNLLTRLRSDLRSESDRLRARLSLELVCGLLDEGELREAEAAAHPVVDEPVRATSAASIGRLMLALATRVYLPSGQTDRGRHLLDQAAWMAERHGLDGLRADTLTELSRLDEQAGRPAEALEAMRSARAAEHRRMRAVSRAARIVLVEVGANHSARDATQQSVAALVRQLAHPAGLPVAVAPPPQVGPPPAKQLQEPRTPPAAAELVGTVDMDDEGTRLLDREALFRRLRSVRKGERPVALTLVRLEPNGDGGKDDDRGPDTGIMAGLADKVRGMAPDNAEVARSDGAELAVILPATTRDQAEEFAANIRESDWAGAGDMSISTGVAQTDQATTDAAGMLTAARDALTPAQTTGTSSLADTSAALHSALSEDTPTTPLNARPTEQGGRSILSALSIPSGSGGRRRAGEEQPPGGKSRWPAEPAEAPRWTRAERRAQQESTWPTDPTPTPPGGWPTPTEEPSQGKRAATPNKPSFSETVALNRPAHGTQPTSEAGETTRRDLPMPDTHAPAPAGLNSAAPGASSSETTTEKAQAGTTDEAGLSTRRVFSTAGAEGESGFDAVASAQAGTSDETGRAARRVSAAGVAGESGFDVAVSAQAGASDEAGLGARRVSAAGAGSESGFDVAASAQAGASDEGGLSARRAFSAAGAGGESGFDAAANVQAAGTPDETGRAARRVSAGGSGFDMAADVRAAETSDEGGLAARRVFPAVEGTGAEANNSPFALGPPATSAEAAPSANRASAGPDDQTSDGGWGSGDGGFASGLAGLSSGGTLRASEDAAAQRSSYEETKAELARMMSALNAKSLASREGKSNGARQSIPTPPEPEDVPEPPARPDIPEPPEPDPIPAPPPEPTPAPEPGQRSGLMAAFDALTGPLPGLRAEFDDAAELPARRPAKSWAELESSAVVESPADDLFGTEVKPAEKPKFRSSLGAAFAEFGAEKKVTEPVKETVQETSYDEPIGPQPRPDGPPRRGERSSATIASLLTEALAAYQSTAEDSESHRAPERFDSFVSDDADRQQSGIRGRHRSPE